MISEIIYRVCDNDTSRSSEVGDCAAAVFGDASDGGSGPESDGEALGAVAAGDELAGRFGEGASHATRQPPAGASLSEAATDASAHGPDERPVAGRLGDADDATAGGGTDEAADPAANESASDHTAETDRGANPDNRSDADDARRRR
jgi:hypothetical protein